MIRNGMRPIHPGEILREEFLVPLHMTSVMLAMTLGVSPAIITGVTLERQCMTADLALKLAGHFGGGAQLWLDLQQSYDQKITSRTDTSDRSPPAST